MKILITGATGFIGKRLARRLQSTGHTLTGLSRSPERASLAVPGVEFFPWEPGKPIPADLMRPVDAVVNLAGESVNGRWSDAKKALIMDSRVQGTRAIVDAMKAAGPGKTLVNASAIGVYGERGDDLLTEAAAPGEGFLKEVVLRWEEEARIAEANGSRVVLLRLGIALGPDGGALEKLLPLAKLGMSGPVGSGRQWWSWVHIDDAVSAIAAAVVEDWSGVYNVSSPNPVRQKEFASVLGKVVNRPAFMPVPAFAIRLMQGEFADELLFSKRVLPERLQKAGFRFEYPDLEQALRQLVSKEARIENVPAHT